MTKEEFLKLPKIKHLCPRCKVNMTTSRITKTLCRYCVKELQGGK